MQADVLWLSARQFIQSPQASTRVRRAATSMSRHAGQVRKACCPLQRRHGCNEEGGAADSCGGPGFDTGGFGELGTSLCMRACRERNSSSSA